jgi:hypothetical protein
VLFSVAYAVMFVIRPASMIARDDLVFTGPRAPLDVSTTFSKMLLLALLGAVGFVVAYEFGFGARLARRVRGFADVDMRRVTAGATLFAGIGIAAFVIFDASTSGPSMFTALFRGLTPQLEGAIEQTSFYIWFAFLFLIPAAFTLLAVGLAHRRRVLVLGALGLMALFLLRAVPLGARADLLSLVGGLFVFVYLRRSARPSLPTLVALAAVVLVTSAFLSDLRGRSSRDETLSATVVRATKPSRLVTPFTSGPDSEMAPALAAALTVIPSEFPYAYGRTILGDLLSRPVPRFFWNDKPPIPRKKLIRRLWPVESTRGTINPEFSTLLYFYWDFGAPGVVAGLFLYGLAARLLFEYFIRHRNELPVQVLYSLALPFLITGVRDSPVDTFVRVVFILLPAVLIFRLAEKRPLPIPATMLK